MIWATGMDKRCSVSLFRSAKTPYMMVSIRDYITETMRIDNGKSTLIAFHR